MNGHRIRNFKPGRYIRSANGGNAKDDLPAMLGGAEKQDGSLFVRDVQAGRYCLALLALSVFGGLV